MAVIEERIPQVKQQRPRRKGNRKLVFWLVLFFLTVLIIVFIRSPYSKVQEIQVIGRSE
ncbi:cell division protein DivIB, partial [Mesorhizobium sp. M00.F.Ca.ET.186.01.1.1]